MINHCVGKLPGISLLEYLGLSDEILPTPPTEVVQNEKFNVCSSGITVQENGKVAVHDSSRRHASATRNDTLAAIFEVELVSLFLLFFLSISARKTTVVESFRLFSL